MTRAATQSDDYAALIAAKSQSVASIPIPHRSIAGHLFPHQADICRWALRRGRAAVFADTGLGKTAIFLEWARHAAEHGRVIILAPLAVAQQIVREAGRFGVDGVRYLRDDDGETPIVVTNYEMLSHFESASFRSVVLDESSILKAYTGKIRNQIIGAFAETPWRLACTATPAPNDHTELGNHSEFLGIKTRTEMLAEYFAHDGGSTQDWRIKGHAALSFWRWVGSWGVVLRKPSDLGHSDDGFALPPLRMHEHVVSLGHKEAHAAGFLFAQEAASLSEQRATRRATLDARVAAASEVCSAVDGPVLVWCEMNDESSAITRAVDGAVELTGSDAPEVKAEKMLAFSDGKARVLVTKPSIAGFGMNWQHCHTMVFAGVSHSYEQTYQAIRRCWRFGQRSPVDVHVIRSDADGQIVANLRRKESDAARMGDEMVANVAEIQRAEVCGSKKEWNDYNPTVSMTVPTWARKR